MHEMPEPLAPVLAFVNSMDVEESTDEWAGGPSALSAWLARVGLIPAAGGQPAAADARSVAGARSAGGGQPAATDARSVAGAPSTSGRKTGVRATAADLAVALELRTGLRAMTLANNGVPADDRVVAAFTRTLAAFPLVVQPDGLTSAPGGGPVAAAFGRVVAGYAYGVATGEFSRMRQCPAGDCSWVFWDSSAKGARRWCTMGVCGNRAKVRAYAARRSPRTAPNP